MTHVELVAEVQRLAGSMSDPKIGKLLGCPRWMVARIRWKSGLAPCGSSRRPKRVRKGSERANETMEDLNRIEAEQRLCLPEWFLEAQKEMERREQKRNRWVVPMIKLTRFEVKMIPMYE